MTATEYGLAHLVLFVACWPSAVSAMSIAYQSKGRMRVVGALVGVFGLLVAGYSGFRAVQSLMT